MISMVLIQMVFLNNADNITQIMANDNSLSSQQCNGECESECETSNILNKLIISNADTLKSIRFKPVPLTVIGNNIKHMSKKHTKFNITRSNISCW